MKNFLINLSRRRSLMVPVVTLMAITIGISGYYIQDRQIAAREETAKQQKQEKQKKEQAVTNTTETEVKPKETVEPSTQVTEDGTKAEVIDIALEIENKTENNEISVTATLDTKKNGNCVFTLKQGNYGPEETLSSKEEKCQATFANPGSGEWTLKVLFTSDDGKTRGDTKQIITL